jgi:hypothetical protein
VPATGGDHDLVASGGGAAGQVAHCGLAQFVVPAVGRQPFLLLLPPPTGPRLVQVGMSARIFADGSIVSVRALGPYRGRQN